MVLLAIYVYVQPILIFSSMYRYSIMNVFHVLLCNRIRVASILGLCFIAVSWKRCRCRGWNDRSLWRGSRRASRSIIRGFWKIIMLGELWILWMCYFRVWNTTPLNLFFLHVPLFNGSKSLKNYLYLSLLTFDVLLIYYRTWPTFSGMNPLLPVPLLGTSLILVIYAKS